MVFYSLYFRTHCHATEDPEKVELALRKVIGLAEITKSSTEGYYGNKILVLEAKLSSKNAIMRFFSELKVVSITEKLLATITQRVDENCCFYFRLDKQASFEGLYKLANSEDAILVKCKIKVFPQRRSQAILILKKFLENL
jgi:hypothetical protein